MYEVRWTMDDLGEFGGYAANLAEQKRGRNYGATYERS